MTSNGHTITTIVQQTSIVSAGSTVVASSRPSTRQQASHTGAIVGGVIGGLAFLALLAAAFLWYRRRSRYKSEFDGNFDPARVTGTRPISAGPEMITAAAAGGTLPRMNIEDDDDGMGGRLPDSTIGGGIVTPFIYAPSVSAYNPSSRSQSPPVPSASPPPMSQYSQDGYPPTLSSAGGYYTAVPQQPQAVGGYYPPGPPSSSSSSAYTPRSVKEREALGARGAGFAVANPSHDTEPRAFSGGYDEQYQAYLRAGPQNRRNSQGEFTGPSSSSPISPTASSSSSAGQRTSGVLVHQDGGRVDPVETVPEEQADEIPPTYDSLPSGERK
ncbi:hypothetical protein B0H11DRAFT_2084746 [Mycena galericulata]|nr:hypothetical protein B0H11DRAFT_2084746 [Mycena galericulata]